jgi:hypothetical protein
MGVSVTITWVTLSRPGRISIARFAPRGTPAGYRVYSPLAPGDWGRADDVSGAGGGAGGGNAGYRLTTPPTLSDRCRVMAADLDQAWIVGVALVRGLLAESGRSGPAAALVEQLIAEGGARMPQARRRHAWERRTRADEARFRLAQVRHALMEPGETSAMLRLVIEAAIGERVPQGAEIELLEEAADRIGVMLAGPGSTKRQRWAGY